MGLFPRYTARMDDGDVTGYVEQLKSDLCALLSERSHPVACHMLIAPQEVEHATLCIGEIVDDLYHRPLLISRIQAQ